MSRSLFSKTLVKDGKEIQIPVMTSAEKINPPSANSKSKNSGGFDLSIVEKFSVSLQPRLDHFNFELAFSELKQLEYIKLRYRYNIPN